MIIRATVERLRSGQLGQVAPLGYSLRTELSAVLDHVTLGELTEVRPRPSRLDMVAEKVRRCCISETSISASSLEARDWRIFPWIMWSRAPFAGHEERLLNALEDFILTNRPRSTIKALTFAYLANFDASKSSVIRVGRLLRDRALSPEDAFGARWLEIDRRFSIFDASKGPYAIAQHVVESLDHRKALGDAGIDQSRFNESLSSCAFKAAIEITAEMFRKGLDQELMWRGAEQLFAWNQDRMRNLQSNTKIAESILQALSVSNASMDIKERVVRRIVEMLGDPRVQHDRWISISRTAHDEAMRILVRTTLDDFFRVISATVENGTQWDERKAFWWAYYEAGAIRDAWVAFGARATEKVKRLEQGYAKFRGATSTHSALILRIQDLIIVESSHDGRCRFFPCETRAWSPRCYEREYDRKELQEKCRDDLPHQGNWRPRFAGHIFAITGVRHPKYGSWY